MRISFRLPGVAFLFAFVCACANAQNATYLVPDNYATIQSAVDAAQSGDTILVTDNSTYAEHIDFKGMQLTLQARNYGGPTIDGTSTAGPAITISGSSTNDSVIEGFIITNAGKGTSASSPHGAIYINGALATIENNTFVNNFCTAIYSTAADPIIANNSITGTLSTGCPSEQGLGSGISIHGHSTTPRQQLPYPSVTHNKIFGNTNSVAYTNTGGGGGLSVTGANGVLAGWNLFYDNVSTGYGGAFYIDTTPTVLFLNNLVENNKGVSGGLDIVIPAGSVTQPTSYIANNTATATNAGADIYLRGDFSGYTFANNTVAGNSNTVASVICGGVTGALPLVSVNNDFYNFTNSSKAVGSGCPAVLTASAAPFLNVSTDPRFTGGGANAGSTTMGGADFHLLSTSPVIDTGNNSIYPLLAAYSVSQTVDLDANPRYVGIAGPPVIDPGAYEYQTGGTTSPYASISLQPATYTPTIGASLTLTATVNFIGTGVVTGSTVSFYQDGQLIGSGLVTSNVQTNSLTATYPIPSFPSGQHYYYATITLSPLPTTYSIPFYLVGTTPTLTATQTKLTSSKNPSNFGDPVIFTATVTNEGTNGLTPTGTVYLTDGAASLGNQPLTNGVAVFPPISTLTAGTHSLTAAFVATGNFSGSTGSLTQIVNAAPLASSTSFLVVSPTSSSYYSQAVTLVAFVSPTSGTTPVPTGSVTFTDNGTTLGTANLTAGSATLNAGTVAVGNHTLSCIYSGDSVYATSPCNNVTHTVTVEQGNIALVADSAPIYALTPTNFTATLTSSSAPGNPPIASQTITFSAGGAQGTATTNASGKATTPLTFDIAARRPPSLQQTITATATNPSVQATTTVNVTVTPNPTSTTMLVSPSPAYQGQAVTIGVSIAALTGASTPNGTVTLSDNGTTIATKATNASTLICPIPGATCAPVATVTFSINTLAVGDHSLTATYTPDANFLASSTASATALTIQPSGFTLTADPAAISIQTEHHKSLTLTVTAVGAYQGSVYLSCDTPLPPVLKCELAQPIVNVAANGTATTTLTLETDAINNFYAADTRSQHGLMWALGGLLPLAVFGAARTRRKKLRALVLALVAFSAFAFTSGCTGKWPNHTPPGSYVLRVQGTSGSATPQTATIVLTVTP